MARLVAELVRRGLARARGQAAELVSAGRVQVSGRPARKASQQVDSGTEILVFPGVGDGYVGRGAHKLAGVLDDLRRAYPPGVPVEASRCLDAGASTGGFTQVLLENGASHVLAVDVGHGQLAGELRDDPRVVDLSGTTVRGLGPAAIGGPVDLVVADLSFISLSVVLPDLAALLRPSGQLLLLVKPQFEVGRARLGSGGVVRDPALRAQAVLSVLATASGLGLAPRAVRASRWPGPSGNVEFFVWLVPAVEGAPAPGTIGPADLDDVVRQAVEEGPS